MTFLEQFQDHLASLRLGDATLLVAVSGGPDSVALLDLLGRSREVHPMRLIVGHVDHGIHPESERIAGDVAAIAIRYDLPFELGQLQLGAAAGETVARAARYAWLEAARRRVGADFIVTAHHADDQAETVLMRVLRGSGPAGLSAMAVRRGTVVRPLLPFRRQELAAHLTAVGLSAWLDPANADVRHVRSWLRAEVLPAIRGRLPDIDRDLRRLATQAARDRAAWDALLDRLPDLAFRVEDDGASMAAEFLVLAEPALSQALLAAAARRAGCQLGPARLARVMSLLRSGASGATVPLGGPWRAALSFGRLHLVGGSREPSPTTAPWTMQGDAGEHRWGRWHFRWHRGAAPERQEREGNTAWFAASALLVRSWQSGDRIRPLAGVGQRSVAQCLQELRVPRWRRTDWPAVAASGAVVWVPGVCRSDALVPPPAEDALRVEVVYI